MPKFKGFGANKRSWTVYKVEKAEFIDWLCLPKSERVPQTQTKMADHLGVHRDTLQAWKRDPVVVGEVLRLQQFQLSVADYPSIIEALKTQATDPKNPRSVVAAKELIRIIERQDDSNVEIAISELSNKDLQALAAELYDVVGERLEPEAESA